MPTDQPTVAQAVAQILRDCSERCRGQLSDAASRQRLEARSQLPTPTEWAEKLASETGSSASNPGRRS